MLDPAFTFARPNNRQTENATLDFPLSARLQPGSGPGNLADEPTLRALFFANRRDVRAASGDLLGGRPGRARLPCAGRLLSVVPRSPGWSAGYPWLRLRRRSPGRFVPRMLPIHGRGRDPRPAKTPAAAPLR